MNNKYYLCTTSISCKNYKAMEDSLRLAKTTSYEKVSEFCPELPEWEQGMGYTSATGDLQMVDDDNVSFYESSWNGERCFIISFYGIDNVFIEDTYHCELPAFFTDAASQSIRAGI